MGESAKDEVRTKIRELKDLRERIDGAIRSLQSRSMVVTPEPPEPPGPVPVTRARQPRHRDPKAQEHTLHYLIQRGAKGATPTMIARTFRITTEAARSRLRTLVSTGLVLMPTNGVEIYKAVP